MTEEDPVSDSVLAAGGDAYTYMLQQTSNSTKATATELAETGRCGIVTENQDCFGFDIHKGYPARCALPPARLPPVRSCVRVRIVLGRLLCSGEAAGEVAGDGLRCDMAFGRPRSHITSCRLLDNAYMRTYLHASFRDVFR